MFIKNFTSKTIQISNPVIHRVQLEMLLIRNTNKNIFSNLKHQHLFCDLYSTPFLQKDQVCWYESNIYKLYTQNKNQNVLSRSVGEVEILCYLSHAYATIFKLGYFNFLMLLSLTEMTSPLSLNALCDLMFVMEQTPQNRSATF